MGIEPEHVGRVDPAAQLEAVSHENLMGEIMRGKPVILSSELDHGDHLERIEAKSDEGRNEAWLQSLIHQHPEILPVESFDETYAPAIPVGREISTSSGYIDNLYVSPSGAITAVETKLWTNPERHRTVVAQIIDYA